MPYSIHSPLPASLKSECKKAAKILESFSNFKSWAPDKSIPPKILAQAKGLAVITIFKAGFMWTGRFGSGLLVARLPDGSWSGPSALGCFGGGFGGQAGIELTDFVLVLNSDAAVKALSRASSGTLGGNLTVAAGPIGRNLEYAGAMGIGGVAAVYSYSETRGIFVGLSLEGGVLIEGKAANKKFYGDKVSARQILAGQATPPPEADCLMQVLRLPVFVPNAGAVTGPPSAGPEVVVVPSASNEGSAQLESHAEPRAEPVDLPTEEGDTPHEQEAVEETQEEQLSHQKTSEGVVASGASVETLRGGISSTTGDAQPMEQRDTQPDSSHDKSLKDSQPGHVEDQPPENAGDNAVEEQLETHGAGSSVTTSVLETPPPPAQIDRELGQETGTGTERQATAEANQERAVPI